MMKVAVLNLLHWGNQVVEESEQAEHKGTEFILEELGNPTIIPLPEILGIVYQ